MSSPVTRTSSNSGPIRVLLADDQDSIRSAFRFFLDAQPDIDVVGEAADGDTAFALARQSSPDVAVLDIRMPGMNGLDLTRALVRLPSPRPIRVVVVTTFDLDEYVYTALTNGACGFLLKDAGPVLLAEAVRAAHAGDSLISPSITVRLLRDHVRPADARAETVSRRVRPPPSAPLTDRELEVVELLGSGMTNAEIADRLTISFSTAKTHVASIQAKLGLRNRVEIAIWAWQTGHTARS